MPAGPSTTTPRAAASCTTRPTTRCSIGLIVALNYKNPHLSPYRRVPALEASPGNRRRVLEGGKRIAYGARAVNKGGLQSLPKLSFPGRHARGLRRRSAERRQDQGRAHGHQVGNAGGGGGAGKALANGDEGSGRRSDSYDEAARTSILGVQGALPGRAKLRSRRCTEARHVPGVRRSRFLDQNIYRRPHLPFTLAQHRRPTTKSLDKVDADKASADRLPQARWRPEFR